jgi:hypothetical protein
MRPKFIAATATAIAVVAVGLSTPATARPAEYDPAMFVVWAQDKIAGNGAGWSTAKIRREAGKVCSHGTGYSATLHDKGLSASFARQFAAKAKSLYCPPSTSKPNNNNGGGDALTLA